MNLNILQYGDPALRIKARSVEHGADRTYLVRDMVQTMDASNGIGLAAPQVGVHERIIVARVNKTLAVLINPQIVRHSKHREWGREGCLSIPGEQVGRRRWTRVTVEAFSYDWKPVTLNVTGLMARVLQHEIDHLDGILMVDEEP